MALAYATPRGVCLIVHADRVSVMIFTLNEEIHLERCLAALHWTDDVIVIDSFSSDRTEAIARSCGARFFQHHFEGFGSQRNWALDNTQPRYQLVLVLDADEIVTPELASELLVIAKNPPEGVGAWRVKRRFHMWGRWLRYSSLYPTWVVRLFALGRLRYVNRGHAETQTVAGRIADLKGDLIDENLKGIHEWFARQNRYSTKDAEFEVESAGTPVGFDSLFSSDALTRRAALKRLAARIPGRGVAYFLYVYLWRGGFRDGRDGFVFCVMRAMYQAEVAVKAYDLRRRTGASAGRKT